MVSVWLFFVPLASWFDPGGEVRSLYLTGIYNEEGKLLVAAIPLVILFGVAGLLMLVSIFLYRRRVLQMRVCIYNMLILTGGIGLIAFYIWLGSSAAGLSASLHYPVLFPLVMGIMAYLAYRNIKKDEALVRAYERIR